MINSLVLVSIYSETGRALPALARARLQILRSSGSPLTSRRSRQWQAPGRPCSGESRRRERDQDSSLLLARDRYARLHNLQPGSMPVLAFERRGQARGNQSTNLRQKREADACVREPLSLLLP